MGAFPHIQYAAQSDRGRKRTNNEDAYGVFPASGLFCVADGMGGGDDGEVASAATVKAIERFTKECPLPDNYTYPIDGIVSGVRAAVNSASAWIAKRTQEKRLKGCGSTFVCICLDAANPSQAVVLHAGDSRLYRIRGRSIQQITTDHSAAELIGAKNDKEINPMFRGMILRAVGIQPTVELERTSLPIKAGDKILICSDGLTRMMPDKKILSCILSGRDVETTVRDLVAGANNAGGIDNITAELIAIGKLPDPLPTSPLKTVSAADTEQTATVDEDASTKDTAADDGVPIASTDDAFIPSTARDEDGVDGTVDSSVDIPASDTEDTNGESPLADTEEDVCAGAMDGHTSGDDSKIKPSCVRRRRVLISKWRLRMLSLFTNWMFLGGMALLMGLMVSFGIYLNGKAREEVQRKDTIEQRSHQKEQKGTLQSVEAQRTAAEEQLQRDQELEETRALINTPAQQRDLQEQILRAAEAARREEEQKRAAEEERHREEARQREEEQKRAAEEERRREEARQREEVLKRAAEEERCREEARQREEAIAKAQDEVLAAFEENLQDNAFVREFYRLLKEDLIPDGIPKELHKRFSPYFEKTSSREKKIEGIIPLVEDMQVVCANLQEYVDIETSNMDDELSELEMTDKRRSVILARKKSFELFRREAESIVGKDSADPEVQKKSVHVLRLIPEWFDH